MAIKLNNTELNQVLTQIREDYKVMAPVVEPDGGRFADMDNIVYKYIETAEEIEWKRM